jgi:hypothetical protein
MLSSRSINRSAKIRRIGNYVKTGNRRPEIGDRNPETGDRNRGDRGYSKKCLQIPVSGFLSLVSDLLSTVVKLLAFP